VALLELRSECRLPWRLPAGGAGQTADGLDFVLAFGLMRPGYKDPADSSNQEGQMATSKTRDKAAGKAEEAKGRLKSASGALTGKGGRQVKGEATAAKGTARKRKGQLKHLID
jgi:uncharacterized protein YjbJ (UPF0337 family)